MTGILQSTRHWVPTRHCVPRAAGPPVLRARAVLLLEVVVALTLMVLAMGLLGGQLVGGLRMVTFAEEQTRAAQLADRMLALLELDPNTVERFMEYREIDGDFGEQHPGWFWRATAEELEQAAGVAQTAEEMAEEEGLNRVTIEILHTGDPEARDDIEQARVVRAIHLLKASPGRINLAEDFGVPPEQLEQLSAMIPIPGMDPTALDPQALVSLDPEMLMAMLPMILPLLQQFRGGSMPRDLSPDMLRDLLGGNLPLDGDVPFGEIPGAGEFGEGFGGGGNQALRELIRSQLGGQISDEELDSLMSNIGRGRGGGGRRPPPDEGGTRTGGSRQGRTIEELSREREERNRESRRFYRDRGGR